MDTDDKLEVVNDNDETIGLETRFIIHKKGLLHREVHVWFVTPDGQLIFQHRSPSKDTYPDLLDATVGGHVEIGMNYSETAIKETLEETGIAVKATDLRELKLIKSKHLDNVTGTINYAFKMQYGYVYDGDISDLKVESGKSVGFEAWPIEKILVLSDDEKRHFIPALFNADFQQIFKKLQEIIVTYD